ncbi:MAG: SDR family NAD(P)-dependent oxidoreductase [Chloroflexi bacterium]|nr:SDR family NAD(P)-dependent oxidoreductase [Chloroflexota bacterium]
MRTFEGKVAVVTGAASGMGKAFADRFARAGMKVVLADVEDKALQATVQEFTQREYDVLGVRTDVSSVESVEDLARKALDAYGKVHILVNNAGVAADSEVAHLMGGPRLRLWEQSLKDWQWTFDVNLWGVVYGIRTFLPGMIAHGEEGHILNTSSIAGLTSGPALPIYGATKHAVVRISEALHHQLAEIQSPLKVSVLCPGGVNTRIALATRNRPDAYLDNPAERPASEELEKREHNWADLTGARGLAPEAVADRVLKAIEDEQFYILTHDDYDNVIRTRMENILARRNP